MRAGFPIAVFLLFVSAVALAKEPAREIPNAPVAAAPADGVIARDRESTVLRRSEGKPIVDRKFVALAIVSAGSTFADSYTTLFATQNWQAGKTNICNAETQSPYLYGTHPTTNRVYAVASAKSATSVLVAYMLRKHHNRFWTAPLAANSIISLQGVIQNLRACN